jgi:hypothetical protein
MFLLLDIGSDEEPPCDSVLDKVVIAYDVNAVKYLIHTGKVDISVNFLSFLS